MKITVFCIGFLKESYWKQAIDEYAKRLQNYVKLEIVEIPDMPCKEKASEKDVPRQRYPGHKGNGQERQ